MQATGTGDFYWSPPAGLSCTNCANPLATPDSARQYILTIRSDKGCIIFDTVLVKVKFPFKIKYSPNDTICIGQSVSLFANGADHFEWSPTSDLSNSHSAFPIVKPDSTTKLRVIGMDNWGCFKDTGYVTIKVYPIPTVNAGGDKTINIGQSINLTPVISADVTKVTWSPTSGIVEYNFPGILVKPNQQTTYTVEAKNDGGCLTRDKVTIFVICNGSNIFIPNTFSPNGDGANDIFYPRGTGLFKIKTLRLFNRWGELIFEKNNFPANDPAYGWDGMYKGVKLGSDVFVYLIDVICDNKMVLTYKGNIALIQ